MAFVETMADNDHLEFKTLGDFVAGLDECV
jgi:hypothetical protein